MKISERIKAARNRDLRKIVVPAWADDEGPVVFYSSPLTARDMTRIQRKHKDFLNNQTIEGMVDLIIQKAVDEDGEKVFDISDKPELMSHEVSIIAGIVGDIFGDVDDAGDAEKN